jgi:hypothetical protein
VNEDKFFTEENQENKGKSQSSQDLQRDFSGLRIAE